MVVDPSCDEDGATPVRRGTVGSGDPWIVDELAVLGVVGAYREKLESARSGLECACDMRRDPDRIPRADREDLCLPLGSAAYHRRTVRAPGGWSSPQLTIRSGWIRISLGLGEDAG